MKTGKLAVKIGNEWKLVFCRGRGNGNKSTIETTEKRAKALDHNAKKYFERFFPENEFSIV